MLKNYLKIAWRNLLAHRSYTSLTTVGLSIGMAAGILIFLFLRHHLSTDRHHQKLERTYRINTDLYLEDGSVEYNPEAPLPMAQVLRTEYPQVEQAAFFMMNRELTVTARRTGRSEPLRFREYKGTALVEPEWFEILDYEWLHGQPNTALSEPNTAVLTQSQASKYFGDTDPIGQVLTLNNKVDVTITGLVADPPPMTDTDVGLFISMATLKNLNPDYEVSNWYYLNSTNRLYVTLKSPGALAGLEQSLPVLSKKHYGTDAAIFRFNVQPLSDIHYDVQRSSDTIRPALLWSLAGVGLLLIIAGCINFINLTLVKAIRRSKEVGIRKSLGSSRRQLVGQFLLESAIIILLSTAFAFLLVLVARPVFNDWAQVELAFRVDWQMVVFLGLLLGVVTVLAGGYPALILSGFSPWTILRGQLPATSVSSTTVRSVLVIGQFAVCHVLILCSLVVANQIKYIQNADLGFRKDNVVVVTLPNQQKGNREAFRQQLLQQPDIQSVSFSHRPPSSEQQFGGSFKFNGSSEWATYPVRDRLADANYLSTYGLQLVAGRNIMPSDTIREYLINEALLHKLGYQDPKEVLGKKLQYYLSATPLPIVGVVKDFHQKSLREEIAPCFIASQSDWFERAGIRITGQDPAGTLDHIRRVWQQLYPDEVLEYQFLDEQVAKFYETETLISRFINTFTIVAILICCLGLYGLVSQVVVQRTKEIGIRKVLGASVSSIVGLLSRDFVRLIVISIVLASPVAWYIMHLWLQDFVYKVSIEWWVYVVAGAMAVGIGILSLSYQSIQAALMNPVKAIKTD
ncbi:ABC transporter permease [Telluribacter humicola]|uniref:ABC transporter permease n=1 Tax=Telluribacter humicola TaxID=1720261 RepID=UPI001A974B8B|nr:ABC transporter permease [Telluribacter humicola]